MTDVMEIAELSAQDLELLRLLAEVVWAARRGLV